MKQSQSSTLEIKINYNFFFFFKNVFLSFYKHSLISYDGFYYFFSSHCEHYLYGKEKKYTQKGLKKKKKKKKKRYLKCQICKIYYDNQQRVNISNQKKLTLLRVVSFKCTKIYSNKVIII